MATAKIPMAKVAVPDAAVEEVVAADKMVKMLPADEAVVAEGKMVHPMVKDPEDAAVPADVVREMVAAQGKVGLAVACCRRESIPVR